MSIEIYQEMRTIKTNEHKSIYLVQSAIDHLYYIKRVLTHYDRHIYELLQTIQSSHLPRIIEFKEEDETLIVIEEYINAPTLDTSILNHEIHHSDIKKIMNQLCDVLVLLHKHHIIHRDLKPENIFYTNGQVILFDFDIARIHQPSLIKDTVVLGSVGYAAPEQFGFQQSDERTDIYAMGVLLNVLYTQHLPNEELYQGPEKYIIQKAVAIDPAKRYQTVIELKSELNKKLIMESWTLPGFRSGKLSYKIISSIGYFVLMFAILFSYVEGAPKWSLESIMTKVLVFIFIFIIFVFSTNYKNINRYVLFHKSDYKILQIIGVILAVILTEFLFLVIAGFISLFYQSFI